MLLFCSSQPHRPIPVGWKIPGLGTSGLRVQVAIMSAVICLGLPMVVDVWSLCKFAHGTYYQLASADGDCRAPIDSKKCIAIGTVLTAFVPNAPDIKNASQTQYRYEGNKDFIPIYQPLAYLIAVVIAVSAGILCIYNAIASPKSGPGAGVAMS